MIEMMPQPSSCQFQITSRRLGMPGLECTEFSVLMEQSNAHTMARFYLAVVHAKLLYGSETWVLTNTVMHYADWSDFMLVVLLISWLLVVFSI
jgi:hypothetical protein